MQLTSETQKYLNLLSDVEEVIKKANPEGIIGVTIGTIQRCEAHIHVNKEEFDESFKKDNDCEIVLDESSFRCDIECYPLPTVRVFCIDMEGSKLAYKKMVEHYWKTVDEE